MNKITLASPSLWDATPVEFIDACAGAGYDGVGLRLNASPMREFFPVVGNKPLIGEMKRKMADAGMIALDIYAYYLMPDIDFDSYRASLELGAEFGAKYCVVVGSDPDWSRSRDSFARICDMAADCGLTAMIEFAPAFQLGTLSEALRLIREAGRPNAALMADPVHFGRSGGHPSELRALDPKLFPYAQLADGVLGAGHHIPEVNRFVLDCERRLPGEGSLPLSEYMDIYPAGLPLSIECLPRPQGMSHLEWAKLVLKATRSFLEAYYNAASQKLAR